MRSFINGGVRGLYYRAGCYPRPRAFKAFLFINHAEFDILPRGPLIYYPPGGLSFITRQYLLTGGWGYLCPVEP